MKTILLLAAFSLSTFAAADSDVLAAMESLKEAMIHRDGAALEKLLNDDLMYTHSTGSFENKAEMMKAITSGKSVIEKLEFSNTTVRIYGDTALVKGRVDLWHSPTDIVHMDILHVWVKKPGGWRLAARQATRLAK